MTTYKEFEFRKLQIYVETNSNTQTYTQTDTHPFSHPHQGIEAAAGAGRWWLNPETQHSPRAQPQPVSPPLNEFMHCQHCQLPKGLRHKCICMLCSPSFSLSLFLSLSLSLYLFSCPLYAYLAQCRIAVTSVFGPQSQSKLIVWSSAASQLNFNSTWATPTQTITG